MQLNDLRYLPREAQLANGNTWSPPLRCPNAQLWCFSAAPNCLTVRTGACGVFQSPH